MTKSMGVVLFCVVSALSACGESKGASAPEGTHAQQRVAAGSDRDAHGCIGSAGYRWCARLEKCVRPWELAKEEGFNKDEKAFEKFCQPKQKEKQ